MRRSKHTLLLVVLILAAATTFGPGNATFGQQVVDSQTANRTTADDSDTRTNTDSDAESLPPPPKEYHGRRIAPYMSYLGAPWLVREERAREENSELLLKALKVPDGGVVCDLGCGNGYYTLQLSKLVGPRGRVLAVDIQQEMLDMLAERTRARGVTNVEPVLGTVADPKLPDGEVDLALLVDVYHEFSYPEQMLRAIRRSLKPDGRVVLVEFREEDPAVPIRPLHKMSKQQVNKELTANGYTLVEEFDGLPWQHVMFYRRAESDSTAP